MSSSFYYPEMGGQADASALFHASNSPRGVRLKWSPAKMSEALAAFRRCCVRPANVETWRAIGGGERASCRVTHKAYSKLVAAGLVTTELLLD